MKKKLGISIILSIFIVLTTLNFHQVKAAFTGELDPENYITMPRMIQVKDNVGTGTVSLVSTASEYSISYQKVDLTESEYSNINTKITDLNNYIETSNATITQKQTAASAALSEYNAIKDSTTATDEEKTAARTKYENAQKDYEDFYNAVKAQVETKQSEIYSLIPNYTDSWTQTTNTTNNLRIEYANRTGKVQYVIWVKITNGTNTYYDMNVYSSNISASNEKEPEQGTETGGEWTKFSNAKLELKKQGISKSLIEISNVTPKEGSRYYLFINSNSNKPNVTSSISDDRIELEYDSASKTFKTLDSSKVARYVELNQKLYITILEKRADGEEDVVTYGNEIKRYIEASYNEAFHATFMTKDKDQIVTTFTHAQENNRKMQIKIGKITDKALLKKIQNKDASAFSELLKYAKANKSIYNQVLDADKDDAFAIEYTAGGSYQSGNNVITLNGLENDAYYFLYIMVDDEDGKYLSQEAVTLAQADTYKDGWSLFFYGSNDFEWADLGDTPTKDDTTIKGVLPQTGVSYIVISAAVIAVVVGAVSAQKYRKYKI